jgi:ubiquinone biosynthesis protein
VAWLKRSVAYLLREQLAGLGPSAAEIARIMDESEGLVPGIVVEELRRRPVRAESMPTRDVEQIARRAFGPRIGRVVEGALAVTPVTQLHRGVLDDKSAAFLRVRRPGAKRELRADARITANLLAPLELLVPAVREAHPLGFIELATRQALEEIDLRNDALNAIELGIALEELDRPGVVVCRPIPDLVSERAVALEAFEGAASLARSAQRVDPDLALPALVGITVEAALAHGVFHADLRPENLLAVPDGRIVIVGCGTVGRLDPATRRAALDYLAAILSGDFEGQVAAMRATGAVPEDADLERLVEDLAGAETLQPSAILAGGETSLVTALREAVTLLLRHRLRPPLELVLFVRAIFSLRSLLAKVAPEHSLLQALWPVVARLPELRAELDG